MVTTRKFTSRCIVLLIVFMAVFGALAVFAKSSIGRALLYPPKRPQPWIAKRIESPAAEVRVAPSRLSGPASVQASTFVTYIFAESDPESTNNLQFFLRHAVHAGDLVEYMVVLQSGASAAASTHLYTLAAHHKDVPNLHFVRHPNRCFDVGTFGEFLMTFELGGSVPAAYSDEQVSFKIADFKFFAIINSGIRGPFLPLSHDTSVHWLQPFINMLNTNDVKLVGPTIACGPTPHVQSYMWVFDRSGLDLLKSEASIFACYKTQKEQVDNVEVGASQFLLGRGFNIASLMLRYNGVDFRQPANNDCNRVTNPLPMAMHNGVSLDALEVMFIKYKKRFLRERWDHVLRAQRYTEYAEDAAAGTDNSQRVIANQFADDPIVRQLLFQTIVGTHAQGDFDIAFYRDQNYDLAQLSDHALWGHFAEYGYAEARPHRWKQGGD